MRRKTVAAAALLLSQAACGDIKREWDEAQAETDAKQAHDASVLVANLSIDNNWAEAQFTVTDNTFGDDIVPQMRIAADSSQVFEGIVKGHPDAGANLTVNAVAAQTYKRFDFNQPVQAGRTLHLSFTFDSVQLVFAMTPSWSD